MAPLCQILNMPLCRSYGKPVLALWALVPGAQCGVGVSSFSLCMAVDANLTCELCTKSCHFRELCCCCCFLYGCVLRRRNSLRLFSSSFTNIKFGSSRRLLSSSLLFSASENRFFWMHIQSMNSDVRMVQTCKQYGRSWFSLQWVYQLWVHPPMRVGSVYTMTLCRFHEELFNILALRIAHTCLVLTVPTVSVANLLTVFYCMTKWHSKVK